MCNRVIDEDEAIPTEPTQIMLTVPINPSLLAELKARAEALGLPFALAVHEALSAWSIIGQFSLTLPCPDHEPWRTVTYGEGDGAKTFTGCRMDNGHCPFNGSLAKCGERG